MTALPSNGGSSASHLRDHLASALYAQLLSAGTLPDAIVRAERDRLDFVRENGTIARLIFNSPDLTLEAPKQQ